VARSQENGIVILLRFKGYEVSRVMETAGSIFVEVKAEQDYSFYHYSGLRRLCRYGLDNTLL